MSYNMPLTASWALDLWGSVRRTIEGNIANAQTSAANVANARLLALIAARDQLLQPARARRPQQLLDTTVAVYQKSLELTRNRYNAGVAARVDWCWPSSS